MFCGHHIFVNPDLKLKPCSLVIIWNPDLTERYVQPPDFCVHQIYLYIVWELAGGGSVAVVVDVSDMWPVSGDRWHATRDRWQMTVDIWQLTCDRWHMTCDMCMWLCFILQGGGGVTKGDTPSSCSYSTISFVGLKSTFYIKSFLWGGCLRH